MFALACPRGRRCTVRRIRCRTLDSVLSSSYIGGYLLGSPTLDRYHDTLTSQTLIVEYLGGEPSSGKRLRQCTTDVTGILRIRLFERYAYLVFQDLADLHASEGLGKEGDLEPAGPAKKRSVLVLLHELSRIDA